MGVTVIPAGTSPAVPAEAAYPITISDATGISGSVSFVAAVPSEVSVASVEPVPSGASVAVDSEVTSVAFVSCVDVSSVEANAIVLPAIHNGNTMHIARIKLMILFICYVSLPKKELKYSIIYIIAYIFI